MLASCFVLEPVEDAVDEAAVVLVVAVSGADGVTTFEATVVMVAVFEEAVGAADVTICWVAVVDGGVAVVMVEF